MQKVTDYNRWKKTIRFFKNKYIFALTIFTVYALFLDDEDVFTMISQNNKLRKTRNEQVIIEKKLNETTRTLNQMHHYTALERYAREEKLFKKDNEDIFIISYE